MGKEKSNNTNSFIFGRNPVREALKANRVVSISLNESFNDSGILELIKLHHVNVKHVSTKELDNKCHGVHQGVMAEVKPYEYLDFNEILKRSSKVTNPIIVILDGINDPQNMGTILRSCDVFGVSGILVPKHNQVPLNATVAKTSAGAINYVPVAVVSNLNQVLTKLKSSGFWIISADGSAKLSYSELKYDFPVALVIGSEGEGISQLVLKNSDYIVKIPEGGHINSLNASVAAGILLSRIRASNPIK